jgi:acetylornithine deacetylase/succinyl-diaminopimelate desuccinylase-like protein
MTPTPTPPASDRDGMLAEFGEFLAIPSISALPAHAGDCRRAAEWLAARFRRMGCPVVTLIEGEGHPLVWAEGPPVPGAPTLLMYGHYDVQPVDPLNEWISPPFTPTVREGRVYARGASDDKGQVYCLLKAWETVLDGGRPPINARFLIEGEEESGGRHIESLLAREPERTVADAVLVADMAYYAPGWPAVYTALRGMCYAEIHLRTLRRDLHSGGYGGVAPNAIEEMVRLLGRLKRPSGRINLPEIYRAVVPPTRAERRAWRALPFDAQAFLRHEVTGRALTGVRGYTPLERTWMLPTFEIHGIRGGFTGEGSKTVIPAQATAKVSLRLVPGLSWETVGRWLRRAVERHAPDYAEVEVRLLHGTDPVQVDVTARPFEILGRAFERVVGRRPVPIRSGGSIPVVSRLAASGAPILLTGIGLPDDGLHSPNEKLDLQQLRDGVAVFAEFFRGLGGGEGRTASDE